MKGVNPVSAEEWFNYSSSILYSNLTPGALDTTAISYAANLIWGGETTWKGKSELNVCWNLGYFTLKATNSCSSQRLKQYAVTAVHWDFWTKWFSVLRECDKSKRCKSTHWSIENINKTELNIVAPYSLKTTTWETTNLRFLIFSKLINLHVGSNLILPRRWKPIYLIGNHAKLSLHNLSDRDAMFITRTHLSHRCNIHALKDVHNKRFLSGDWRVSLDSLSEPDNQ